VSELDDAWEELDETSDALIDARHSNVEPMITTLLKTLIADASWVLQCRGAWTLDGESQSARGEVRRLRAALRRIVSDVEDAPCDCLVDAEQMAREALAGKVIPDGVAEQIAAAGRHVQAADTRANAAAQREAQTILRAERAEKLLAIAREFVEGIAALDLAEGCTTKDLVDSAAHALVRMRAVSV